MKSLWRLIETYHAVVYFAPERQQTYKDLGFIGGWMPYFATRAAALGRVPPEVVTACFYFFNHSMVSRALPDAWNHASPSDAYRARLEVFDAALKRICAESFVEIDFAHAAESATAAALRAPIAGRPLFAAHVAQPIPSEAHLQLFWAATALREYRGDGHVAALQTFDLTGLQANCLMEALALVPTEQRMFRGWNSDDWDAAVESLRTRGLLDADGHVSDTGRHLRRALEMQTERMAAGAFDGDRDGTAVLATLGRVARLINDRGAIPYPNAMGLEAVQEEDA